MCFPQPTWQGGGTSVRNVLKQQPRHDWVTQRKHAASPPTGQLWGHSRRRELQARSGATGGAPTRRRRPRPPPPPPPPPPNPPKWV